MIGVLISQLTQFSFTHPSKERMYEGIIGKIKVSFRVVDPFCLLSLYVAIIPDSKPRNGGRVLRHGPVIPQHPVQGHSSEYHA